MVDRSDPAFRFVSEANAKEAANMAKRSTRKEPSPWLNSVIMCVLLWVAWTHLMDDALFYAGLFVALAGFNGHIAWRVFRQRKGAT